MSIGVSADDRFPDERVVLRPNHVPDRQEEQAKNDPTYAAADSGAALETTTHQGSYLSQFMPLLPSFENVKRVLRVHLVTATKTAESLKTERGTSRPAAHSGTWQPQEKSPACFATRAAASRDVSRSVVVVSRCTRVLRSVGQSLQFLNKSDHRGWV